MVLHGALATEPLPTAFRPTAAGTVSACLGLWIPSLLYSATGSHPASITWLLLLTPISPLSILFIPETARRELDEIAPGYLHRSSVLDKRSCGRHPFAFPPPER